MLGVGLLRMRCHNARMEAPPAAVNISGGVLEAVPQCLAVAAASLRALHMRGPPEHPITQVGQMLAGASAGVARLHCTGCQQGGGQQLQLPSSFVM